MMMKFLWAIHLTNCVILILVVLLQAGKGSTMGLSIGGGASQTVFGSSGGKNFFARLTSGLAVLFMVTSVLLSVFSSKGERGYRGVMQNLPAPSDTANASQPAPETVPAGK